MHSIRGRIMAAIMVAIATCILVLGGIGIAVVGRVSDEASTEKLQLVSETTQRRLDSYLLSLKQSVDMVNHIAADSLDPDTLTDLHAVGVSVDPSARTPEQDRQLDDYFRGHCAAVLEAFSSVANHTLGVVTYYYCMNPEVSPREHGFFYSAVGHVGFEEQEPLDATLLDPQDMVHNAWYYTVMQKRRASWVGPYPAHFLGERWTVSYVTPVYKSGKIMGVLGMDILFSTFIDQISALEVYDTGFACLLDEDTHILYHPELAMGSLPEEANRSFSADTFVGESSKGRLIRYDADGEERQLSYNTLINGQKLVVTAPVSEISTSQRQVTQIIVVAALLIFGAFAIYALILSGALTRPLVRLTTASQRLADGDYGVELDYDAEDEVGMLTAAFRAMRHQLRADFDDLSSQAFTDALTGVKNKASFNALTAELEGAIRRSDETTELAFAIVLFDCNRLKFVNDEYGHAQGDVYLQTATKAICDTYDHSPVFRIGGDEFAVVLRGRDYDHRDELLELFDRTAAEMSAEADNPWDRVDLARGMSVYRPGEDEDVEHVFRRADRRMYRHKREMRAAREA